MASKFLRSSVMTMQKAGFSTVVAAFKPVRHLRATKNGPGRFYAISENVAATDSLPDVERWASIRKLEKNSAYTHPLSPGVLDSINSIAPELRHTYRAGMETIFDEKDDFPFLVDAQASTNPAAILEYNLVGVPSTTEVVMQIHHTFVPEELRGTGVAKNLVEDAIAYARKSQLKIDAKCTYVAKYLEKNAEATRNINLNA